MPADFPTLLTLAAAGISGSFANVGAVTTQRWRGVIFINDTQGNMIFSNDGTNNKMFVKAGSFVLWDVQANMNPRKDDEFVFRIGTQWSVKQLTAPVDGDVYVGGIINA